MAIKVSVQRIHKNCDFILLFCIGWLKSVFCRAVSLLIKSFVSLPWSCLYCHVFFKVPIILWFCCGEVLISPHSVFLLLVKRVKHFINWCYIENLCPICNGSDFNFFAENMAEADTPSDIIVVLGCRTSEDGTPSEMLKSRVHRAAELYTSLQQKNIDCRVVVTGYCAQDQVFPALPHLGKTKIILFPGSEWYIHDCMTHTFSS